MYRGVVRVSVGGIFNQKLLNIIICFGNYLHFNVLLYNIVFTVNFTINKRGG